MPSYLYDCSMHGEFEDFHSINDKLEECPKCKLEGKKSDPPKRLIASGGNFILTGSGWARDNYN